MRSILLFILLITICTFSSNFIGSIISAQKIGEKGIAYVEEEERDMSKMEVLKERPLYYKENREFFAKIKVTRTLKKEGLFLKEYIKEDTINISYKDYY